MKNIALALLTILLFTAAVTCEQKRVKFPPGRRRARSRLTSRRACR